MKSLVRFFLPAVAWCAAVPVSAAADADTDWQAIQQVVIAGQPSPGLRSDFGSTFDQRDRLARAVQPLLEAFYAAHPQDPRRWRAVLMLTQHAPTFIARRGPNFATKGMLDVEFDAAARAAHEAKVARYEAAMELAADVPKEVLLQVHSRQLGDALRAAKQNLATADLPALRARYDAFAAQHPGTPFVLSFANIYMTLVETADPARAAREWGTFTSSADERVRQLALEKVRAAGVQASVAALSFTALDGRAVDLAKLRGKVVLIDFWASWCVPCIAELPNVKKVYAAYHDRGFEVVGIALDRQADRQKLIELVARHELPWPQYFDGQYWQTAPAEKFAVKAIPAMFLLDQDGKVVSTNARGEMLGKEVRRLLKL